LYIEIEGLRGKYLHCFKFYLNIYADPSLVKNYLLYNRVELQAERMEDCQFQLGYQRLRAASAFDESIMTTLLIIIEPIHYLPFNRITNPWKFSPANPKTSAYKRLLVAMPTSPIVQAISLLLSSPLISST